jgi:hypothetical protein
MGDLEGDQPLSVVLDDTRLMSLAVWTGFVCSAHSTGPTVFQITTKSGRRIALREKAARPGEEWSQR